MPDLRHSTQDRLVCGERYEAEGLAGLQDRRYGAGNHPNQTDSGIEEQVLQLKQARPSWGAKKLRAHLLAKKKGVKWPVVSTFGEILRRAGLSAPQRKRLRIPLYTKPFEKVEKANQIWCADFKGWFRTGKGERIDPLTMTDAHSRYLLRCQSVEKTNTEQVQAIFRQPFENTVCRRASEPITELRLPPEPSLAFRAYRSAG